MSRTLILAFLTMVSSILTAQRAHLIGFENRQWVPELFDFGQGIEYSPAEVSRGRIYRLIQFDDIPSTEWRAQLADFGIDLLDYYPSHTYLASISTSVNVEKLRDYGVIAIQKMDDVLKMSRQVWKGTFGDWALHGDRLDVLLLYYPDMDEPMVREDLEGAGMGDIVFFPEYQLVKGVIDVNQLYTLPKLPTIRYVSVESEPGEPEDVEGRSLHRANMISRGQGNGLNYDGTGVKVQVRDDGVLGPHMDFKGRLKLNAFGYLNTDHMDMVAGIFAGAGNIDPRAKGMASGADVYATNYTADFLDQTLTLHQNEGVMVTNSSYSNGCNDGYIITTRTVDMQIENNPSLLHVFSAGNNGTSTCAQNNYGAGNLWGNITGGHKQGKNVIANANLRLDVTLETSSSRGPAYDGRIKPDLAARGTGQLSCSPDNLYSPGGGTSAASPGCAGVSAQLYQAYRDLNNGEDPPSALIKAALLNTANDLGNPGPDFMFGWGHLNAWKAYKLLEEKRYQQYDIAHGEVNTHTITLPSGLAEAKIMLYWREPPAAVGVARSLVNDLDLKVYKDGALTLPLVLDHTPDPIQLSMPAYPGIDSVNNVEQVYLSTPAPGEYTIEVHGTTLPFGAREYFILTEEVTEDIFVTYPVGGESLAPHEIAQIQWDAPGKSGIFSLEYSLDGGNTWTKEADVDGSLRYYNWEVPQYTTNQARIRVSRAGLSGTSANFHIMTTPTTLNFMRACPGEMALSWPRVSDAVSYEVYLLGDRFMDRIATVDTNYAVIQVDDVLEEQWVSLKAISAGGAISERMKAVRYSGGLRDCEVDTDVALISVQMPNPYLVYSCGDFKTPLEVTVENRGKTTVEEVTVEYELSNGMSEGKTFLVNLAARKQVNLRFDNPLLLEESGTYVLAVEVATMDDELAGNNRTELNFEYVKTETTASATPYTQDFENDFPPQDWKVKSEAPFHSWSKEEVVGRDGRANNAMHIGGVERSEVTYYDEIYTEAIDLSNEVKAGLYFDYAALMPVGAANSRFSVVVYNVCGENAPIEIFRTDLRSLQTAPLDSTYPWTPDRNDWSNIALNLSEFVGNEIVIGFVIENYFAYDFYIDNINISNDVESVPDFEVTSSEMAVCKYASFRLAVENPSNDLEYRWEFGAPDEIAPATATGPGPHVVRCLKAGNYTPKVYVSDVNSGAVAFRQVEVVCYEKPRSKFSTDVNQNVAAFTNLSLYATDYHWDFGDGETSIEENPVHLYKTTGDYTVILTATNACDSVDAEAMVSIITVGNEDHAIDGLQIYPVPASDKLIIEVDSHNDVDQYQIVSFTGRIEREGLIASKNIEIDLRLLSPGAYFIRLFRSNGRVVTKKILIF